MTSTDIFVTIGRDEWKERAKSTALPLTASDVARLSSLGDPIDLAEADAIYRPLSALLQMYSRHLGGLFKESHEFLGLDTPRTPFIIGVAGSVAVGKSTTARLLRELLRRWPHTPNVDLVTTDGFLLPNAELEAQGIMHRKGFPESYDRHGLLDFLAAVKAGERNVKVPVYDHVSYDITGEFITIDQPDILIVEGLNVLQPARQSSEGEFMAVSDYFDFSIYLDAAEADLERWYIERFQTLRSTAFADERSYFRNYASLTDEQAVQAAHHVWMSINLPNLRENVAPTRSRATVVLRKGPGHTIESVALRKI